MSQHSSYSYILLALQRLDGIDLLEEFLGVLPIPVLKTIKHLVGSLEAKKTQSRLFEISPKQWWLKNLKRMPKMYEVMFGGARGSYYQIGSVTCRITNLPIQSHALERQGLKFVELTYQLYILTEYDMGKQDAVFVCRHFSQNSWLGDSSENISGILVSRRAHLQ